MQWDDPDRTLHYLGIVILHYGSHWMCQRLWHSQTGSSASAAIPEGSLMPGVSEQGSTGTCMGCVCSPLPIALSLGLLSNVELHGHTVSCIICTSWGKFNCKPDKPGTNNGTLDVISVSPKASYKIDLWDGFSAEFKPHNLLSTTNNSEVLVFSSW